MRPKLVVFGRMIKTYIVPQFTTTTPCRFKVKKSILQSSRIVQTLAAYMICDSQPHAGSQAIVLLPVHTQRITVKQEKSRMQPVSLLTADLQYSTVLVFLFLSRLTVVGLCGVAGLFSGLARLHVCLSGQRTPFYSNLRLDLHADKTDRHGRQAQRNS